VINFARAELRASSPQQPTKTNGENKLSFLKTKNPHARSRQSIGVVSTCVNYESADGNVVAGQCAVMMPERRKQIAAELYGKGWTMQRIADTLKVSVYTISKDLEVFSPPKNPARRFRP
jgi:hypothetical protein